MKIAIVLLVVLMAGCAQQQQAATPPPGVPPSLQIVPAQYYRVIERPVRKRGKLVKVEKQIEYVRVVPAPIPPPDNWVDDKANKTLEWYGEYIAGEVEKAKRGVGK